MGNAGIFAVTFQSRSHGRVHQQRDDTVQEYTSHTHTHTHTYNPIIYIHYTQTHASQPYSSLSPFIEIEIVIHSFFICVSVNGLRCWDGGEHSVPSVKGNKL